MNIKYIFSVNVSHATLAVFLFAQSGDPSDGKLFLMPSCFIKIWVCKFGCEMLRLNCSSRERDMDTQEKAGKFSAGEEDKMTKHLAEIWGEWEKGRQGGELYEMLRSFPVVWNHPPYLLRRHQ